MNVAIIGSNGFIGHHLKNALLKKNNINLFLFGRGENRYPDSDTLYSEFDFKNVELIKNSFSKIDVVYYLISSSIPASSWENPIIEIDNNLIPFLNYCQEIAHLEVKKIVFISSAGTVYGAKSNKAKENSIKKPFSPYGITKLTSEFFLEYFRIKYNLNYDIYRVSNVYGLGQDTSKGLGIINTFIENILYKKEINIYGNGENIRNYINVKDVADVLCLSVENKLQKSNIYNLSSNSTISINQLVEIIKNEIKISFKINYIDKRQSDNTIIDVDNTKILKKLKNFSFIPINEGVREIIDFLKTSQ